MKFAAIIFILIGAAITVYAAQVIRVWVALKDLRKLPNVVEVRRGGKNPASRSPLSGPFVSEATPSPERCPRSRERCPIA